MPLNIRIQWNAGTACVSECVPKTLACRGLRVGPSKPVISSPIQIFREDLLICSVAAFGPSSVEDAKHASFPCLVSQKLPQTNLYEIRC